LELKDYTKLLVSSIALLIVVTTIPAFAQTASDPNAEIPVITTSDIPVEILGIPGVQGNVLAGSGTATTGGIITEWTPAGVFVQNWDTTSFSSEQTGMCFDEFGNMRATSFTAGTMTLFDDSANIITHPWAGPFSNAPESCVVDAAGNIYTGEVNGGDNDIRKWSPAGVLLAQFSPSVSRGTDWIDLAADQCTMRYTTEDQTIRQFDVCTNTQLANFASGLPGGVCFAHRILADGGSLVACQDRVTRLDSTGAVTQTYLASGFTPVDTFLFALNLDPDGTSFWTGGIATGNIYRIDIASGNQIGGFTVPIFASMAGLAVIGEITVQAFCGDGVVNQPTEQCDDLNLPTATCDITCQNIVQPICTVDADCDDGLFCTLDSCNTALGICEFAPNPDPQCQRVGGEFIGVDNSALLVAGFQANALWLLPAIAAIGIGVVVIRRIR